MNIDRKNTMGSAIQPGFICKPTIKDPNKPIMFYKSHIIFCMDERCKTTYKNNDKPKELRELIKNLGLHKGAKRVKITRSFCFGACRFRGVTLIYNNSKQNNEQVNNGIWLRRSHKLSQDNWTDILNSLANDIPIVEEFNDKLIPIKVYE